MLLTAMCVVSADLITKNWALRELRGGKIVEVIGPLDLVLTFNRGVAFGLGEGFAPFLIAAAIAVLLFVIIRRHVVLDALAIVAVGLVFGGALGNLGDRIFRATDGAVVDFIRISFWPGIFNVADAAIVIGAVMLVFSASRKKVDPT